MTKVNTEIVEKLVELLKPLKGTGEPYYIDEDVEYSDKIGPDNPIRETVREALKQLDVSDSGGCCLCLS